LIINSGARNKENSINASEKIPSFYKHFSFYLAYTKVQDVAGERVWGLPMLYLYYNWRK